MEWLDFFYLVETFTRMEERKRPDNKSSVLWNQSNLFIQDNNKNTSHYNQKEWNEMKIPKRFFFLFHIRITSDQILWASIVILKKKEHHQLLGWNVFKPLTATDEVSRIYIWKFDIFYGRNQCFFSSLISKSN